MIRRTLMIIAVSASLGISLAACQPKTGSAQGEGPTAPAGDQSAASKAFLAKNAKEPGVVVLPDGLQYKIVSSGPATGQKPHPNDEVKVNYEGKLIDGTVFDSSYERGQPYAAPLPNLVKAWQEALPKMKPGDVWMLYVPPELGYGADGNPPTIPGGAALVFKIELIDFLSAPGSVGNG